MRSLKKIGLLAAAFLVVGSGSARASTIEVKVPVFLCDSRSDAARRAVPRER